MCKNKNFYLKEIKRIFFLVIDKGGSSSSEWEGDCLYRKEFDDLFMTFCVFVTLTVFVYIVLGVGRAIAPLDPWICLW